MVLPWLVLLLIRLKGRWDGWGLLLLVLVLLRLRWHVMGVVSGFGGLGC